MARLSFRQILLAIVIGAVFATLQGDPPVAALKKLGFQVIDGLREQRRLGLSVGRFADFRQLIVPVRLGAIEVNLLWRGLLRRNLLCRSRRHRSVVIAEQPAQADPEGSAPVLRDVEGFSAEDACATLELSEGNQRVLLHRARSRVRRRLAEYLGRE